MILLIFKKKELKGLLTHTAGNLFHIHVRWSFMSYITAIFIQYTQILKSKLYPHPVFALPLCIDEKLQCRKDRKNCAMLRVWNSSLSGSVSASQYPVQGPAKNLGDITIHDVFTNATDRAYHSYQSSFSPLTVTQPRLEREVSDYQSLHLDPDSRRNHKEHLLTVTGGKSRPNRL